MISTIINLSTEEKTTLRDNYIILISEGNAVYTV
jgi:hypothetical protein